MANEPAFPINGGLHDNQHNGMTLRDYFAAKAMQGYVIRGGCPDMDESDDDFDSRISKWSYEMADAMLKARDDNA